MTSLRRILTIAVAAVVVLQPAVACCADLVVSGDAAPAQPAPEAAGHDHCGDPPPTVRDNRQHLCECGDGCASMEARSPKTPDAAVLPAGGEVQPAAVVAKPLQAPPVPRLVFHRGLPPPAVLPLARPTLVSLQRLLLI